MEGGRGSNNKGRNDLRSHLFFFLLSPSSLLLSSSFAPPSFLSLLLPSSSPPLSPPLSPSLLSLLLPSSLSSSPSLSLPPSHRLDDLASQEASLRLREQLLQQEKQLVKTQNEWLSRELQARSEELFQLRKERATIVGGLEGQLASSNQEVCACVCV